MMGKDQLEIHDKEFFLLVFVNLLLGTMILLYFIIAYSCFVSNITLKKLFSFLRNPRKNITYTYAYIYYCLTDILSYNGCSQPHTSLIC